MSMPRRKTSRVTYSSSSWSRIGELASGEKPNAGMPNWRMKRESVAAGKISGSRSIPAEAQPSLKTPHHGFFCASMAVM